MIDIDIPDFGAVHLAHVVFDYNGTLAVDGVLLPQAADALSALAAQLTVHVLTADTFGRAAEQLAGLPITLTILPPGAQAEAKRDYVRGLGATSVVAVGNGRNDRLMLVEAAVGMALVQGEGAAAQTVAAADVVCGSVGEAIEALLRPRRLIATLRS